MKRSLALATSLAVATLAIVATAPAAASEKPRIAVLEFKNKADNPWW